MKRLAAIASVLLACGSCAPAPAPTKPAVQERLEQLAGQLSYFSAREFTLGQTAKVAPDRGGHGDPGVPAIRHRRAAERLYESSAQITRELAWHDWDVGELEALVDHSDAKVRTLAAAALFATDDPQNIPLLFKLVTDEAPTFPAAWVERQHTSGIGGSCLQPQTVGNVVHGLLHPYLASLSGEFPVRPNGDPRRACETAWQARAGHAITCRDFVVWRLRAGGEVTDADDVRHARLERIRERLKNVPMPDQAWYAMVVGGIFGNARGNSDRLLSEEAILGLAQQVGHEKLMRALARDIETTDPTLQPGARGKRQWGPEEFVLFNHVRSFILQKAKTLLQPGDADELLALPATESEFEDRLAGSLWALAAAELQPDRAVEIYRGAFAALGEPNPIGHGGSLAAALWKQGGATQTEFLVDWFYRTLATPTAWRNPMEMFLKAVDQSAEPDGRQLIARIIADPRLKELNWENTKALVGIVNDRLETPWLELDEFTWLGAGFPMSIADSFLQSREKYETESPAALKQVQETVAFWQARLREGVADYAQGAHP